MLAMHAPDGFLQPGVAVVSAAISLAVIALAIHVVASRDFDDRRAALAGVMAAFIFAAQMFNFPVASGTSGHLMGGALAAILLGPWVGSLVVAVVVLVQALVFADGGLFALGYNILNMAIIPAFGGWAVFTMVSGRLRRTAGGVIGAAAIASGASVVFSAIAFSIQWLFGATAPVSFGTVFAAMVGVHALIGVGEAIITAIAVAAVLAVRPDLVTGARELPVAQRVNPAKIGVRAFALSGVLVAAFVAMVVSQFAASHPDGLERVAIDKGFMERASEHSLGNSLFAEYATRGISNEGVSLAIAGCVGVALTLLVGTGLISSARRLRRTAV